MIDRLDHLVLTCHSIEKCVDFYTRILGMEVTMFKNNRRALIFGNQKINIHEYGKEFEPKAHLPVPGSLDLCFIVSKSIPEILSHLSEQNVQVLEGPIERTGARGNIISVYIRDPDLNLIELSVYK
ncbi:VOC family protein [Citrobacter portucalensis]|uniref:VOC family protein n=1 Tax=Enterobacteriaceae TaxID=543 RepID=UPI000846F96A|nr:VOC family protein [Citrobacter sp. CFSAN044567]